MFSSSVSWQLIGSWLALASTGLLDRSPTCILANYIVGESCTSASVKYCCRVLVKSIVRAFTASGRNFSVFVYIRPRFGSVCIVCFSLVIYLLKSSHCIGSQGEIHTCHRLKIIKTNKIPVLNFLYLLIFFLYPLIISFWSGLPSMMFFSETLSTWGQHNILDRLSGSVYSVNFEKLASLIYNRKNVY